MEWLKEKGEGRTRSATILTILEEYCKANRRDGRDGTGDQEGKEGKLEEKSG